MAGFAHLGVGLAAKQVAPKIPVGILVAGAYAIDIVWGGFWLAGVEKYPGEGVAATAPWSHGLFMSLVWSAVTALVTVLITRNRRTALVMGLLVFSHWVVDFIAKPMTHAFPNDAGLPLLFDGSPTVGLGLWRTALGEYIGEYGTVAAGLVIYLLARRRYSQTPNRSGRPKILNRSLSKSRAGSVRESSGNSRDERPMG